METLLKDKFDSRNLSKDSMIAYLSHKIRFSDYINQYRYVVNILIENMENKNIPNFDMIVLPTLFSIRHIFELIIKENIFFYSNEFIVPLPPLQLDTDSHKIDKLTSYIIPYLLEFEKKLQNYKPEKRIIKEFRKSICKMQKHLQPLDNNSYHFRYPIDKNAYLSFEHNLQVNCQNLVDDYYEFIELNYKVWWLTDIIPEHE